MREAPPRPLRRGVITGELKQFSFNQPICQFCWHERNGDRSPVRMNIVHPETCCFCGEATLSGIYVKVNPVEVPYPTITRD